MRRIVHIGLGKAASTTLQKHVYPAIVQSQSIEYIEPKSLSKLLKQSAQGEPVLAGDFFTSAEVLVGPDPKNWDKCLQKNLLAFGSNTTILLILRRPSGYMRSVFQQVSHHTGILIEPSAYFTSVDSNVAELGYNVFDAQKFDQERLVRIYAETFDEVIVQKFETITDLRFLQTAFDLPDQALHAAQSSMSKKSSNRSFSQTAVNISMKLKWMFGAPTINPATGALKRTRRYQLWRDLMQGIFDKVYPYKKYVLDWDTIENVDILEMDATYNKIPQFQHFINGDLQPVD